MFNAKTGPISGSYAIRIQVLTDFIARHFIINDYRDSPIFFLFQWRLTVLFYHFRALHQ